MKIFYGRFHTLKSLTIYDGFVKAHNKNEAREKFKSGYGASQMVQLKEVTYDVQRKS